MVHVIPFKIVKEHWQVGNWLSDFTIAGLTNDSNLFSTDMVVMTDFFDESEFHLAILTLSRSLVN